MMRKSNSSVRKYADEKYFFEDLEKTELPRLLISMNGTVVNLYLFFLLIHKMIVYLLFLQQIIKHNSPSESPTIHVTFLIF